MKSHYAAAMSAYKDNAVTTASPGHIVVMAYERLILDLERAQACFKAGLSASEHLLHAQDLVLALQSNLNVEAWDGGKRLSSLYSYVYEQLVSANVLRDSGKVQECLNLMGPLLDAWRQIERTVGDQPTTPGTSAVA